MSFDSEAHHYVIEADRLDGSGPVKCVCETHELKTEEQARFFGWGQLRGMGFNVTNPRVVRANR